MARWTFLDYISERGVNEIEAWEDCLPVKAVNKMEWLLTYLRGVEHLSRPYVGTRANYPQLYELIIDCAGRAFRPLCCYGPDDGEITILIGAEEKGGKLEPRSAEEVAERRRLSILDRKRVRPRE